MNDNDFTRDPDMDPAMSKMAQRQVLKNAVMTQITCPFTGQILDQRTSVLIMGGDLVVCVAASAYDAARGDIEEIVRKTGDKFEVYDGREIERL